jgi:hypothetical protein
MGYVPLVDGCIKHTHCYENSWIRYMLMRFEFRTNQKIRLYSVRRCKQCGCHACITFGKSEKV